MGGEVANASTYLLPRAIIVHRGGHTFFPDSAITMPDSSSYSIAECEYEQQVASATAATEAAAEAREDEEVAAGIHSGRRKNFLDTSSSGSDDEEAASGSE